MGGVRGREDVVWAFVRRELMYFSERYAFNSIMRRTTLPKQVLCHL